MRVGHKLKWTLIAIACGFTAGTGYVAAQAAYGWVQGDILQHLTVGQADPSAVPPGGVTYITVRYHKRADCPGVWSYYVRWNGSAEWQLMRSGPTGANLPGEYSFRHLIAVPSDAPPGPAQWQEVVSKSCGLWWSSVSRSAPVSFTVAPN